MNFTEFSRISLGINWFSLGFIGFYSVQRGFIGFTGFFLVFVHFTWNVLGFTGFHQILP